MTTSFPLSLLAILALSTGAPGCTQAPDGGSAVPSAATTAGASMSQPFTRLLSATTSGFTEPAETVVREASTLASAWRTLHDGVPGNPPPSVDLVTRTVVVLALGPRNTGGYAVRTDSVTAEGTGATVHYTVTSPGPDCMTAQMLSSPVEIISFARADGQIRFVRRNATNPC